MSDFSAKPFSFATLNNVLGNNKPPIPYSWSGSEVFLQSEEKFDENAYRSSKLNTLLQRQTTLDEESIHILFQQVIDQNLNVLYDLHNCQKEMFVQYDAKFNLLLEAAFSHAENEHSLRLSRENIKNSLQITDGWMDLHAVNNLVRLNSPVPKPTTDLNKFVPKNRR
jgi:hypothetical protein